MSTRSGPIALVLAGVNQAPATGIDWQGGKGTLFVSGNAAGPFAFQCSVDGGVTWIPVALPTGALGYGALAADGAYPFDLAPSRIRANGTTAGTIYASRID